MSGRDRPRCGACGRPVADQAELCNSCAVKLAATLRDVALIVPELDLALSRQTAYSDRNGSRSTTTSLPVNGAASVAASHLKQVLVSWTLLVHAEHYGGRDDHQGPVHRTCGHRSCVFLRQQHLPADDPVALAAWLEVETSWLAHHEAALDAYDEIRAAAAHVRRVIDAPEMRATFTVGPCPERVDDSAECPGEVWVTIPADELEPASMSCNALPAEHRWESHEWRRAGRRIRRRATLRTRARLQQQSASPGAPSSCGSGLAS